MLPCSRFRRLLNVVSDTLHHTFPSQYREYCMLSHEIVQCQNGETSVLTPCFCHKNCVSFKLSKSARTVGGDSPSQPRTVRIVLKVTHCMELVAWWILVQI